MVLHCFWAGKFLQLRGTTRREIVLHDKIFDDLLPHRGNLRTTFGWPLYPYVFTVSSFFIWYTLSSFICLHCFVCMTCKLQRLYWALWLRRYKLCQVLTGNALLFRSILHLGRPVQLQVSFCRCCGWRVWQSRCLERPEDSLASQFHKCQGCMVLQYLWASKFLHFHETSRTVCRTMPWRALHLFLCLLSARSLCVGNSMAISFRTLCSIFHLGRLVQLVVSKPHGCGGRRVS